MTALKGSLLTLARGFCMGAADVIPGVSGGTMAFILGIYPRLVEAVRAFDVQLVRLLVRRELRAAARHADLGFLGWLALGIFTALMFFTRVVSLPNLLRTHPEPVYSLFFGLIAASVVVLLREVRGLSVGEVVALVGGAGAGFLIVNLVPVETPVSAWFVFLSGALAICAMILPGISGSFVLLVLNKYAYVFDAVGRLDLGVLLPFALGAATGLVLFSRVLVWLLHHYYQRTLLAICGMLVGSLWVIWPFQERTYAAIDGRVRLIASSPVWPDGWSGSVAGALGLALVGLATVLALHLLSVGRGQRMRASQDS
jgi:putative membrane protein